MTFRSVVTHSIYCFDIRTMVIMIINDQVPVLNPSQSFEEFLKNRDLFRNNIQNSSPSMIQHLSSVGLSVFVAADILSFLFQTWSAVWFVQAESLFHVEVDVTFVSWSGWNDPNYLFLLCCRRKGNNSRLYTAEFCRGRCDNHLKVKIFSNI